MSDLLAARSQMAVSLAFHILFAVAGIAMPALMVLAEGRWLRTRDAVALELAKRWAKGTAILFAVGAVSGTVLSFELGLLWPAFMRYAGPIVGMPFSLEGFAFFLESIAIGVYLYGWDRVPRVAHWLAGVVIALAGVLSGIFVVAANAWMNTPTGFRVEGGAVTAIDPVAAMLNPAFFSQALHMTLAAYEAVGFAVAGIHAFMLLRDASNPFHRRAFVLALALGGSAALLQPLSGDRSAKMVATTQPAKLAALEGQFDTARGAPLRIGGVPDERAEVTRGALEIPGALSWLAHGDSRAVVRGLKEWPRGDRPPVTVTHLAFQLMVGCGLVLAAIALVGAGLALARRRAPITPGYLKLVIAASPLGLIAIEAGWVVTEVGRQPWIIQGVMRTREAVTPMPGLVVPFTVFTLLYVGLGLIVLALLRRQVFESPR
jgi:cytochrome d ubiquinol oxidase subunit I